MKWTHFYLIRIEYLGYRYHGWQKQPQGKTIHEMIDKTVFYVMQHTQFKTLGCARTDAKVSAQDYAFELFTTQPLDMDDFYRQFDQNLPMDIRAKSIEEVDAAFNIIQAVKTKEYHYHFCFGAKPHPFAAPYIASFGNHLDIAAMQEAAALFVGHHHFRWYASQPSEKTVFDREILKSEIVPCEMPLAVFGVENGFTFQVAGAGFMRHQVRLMAGALREVGRGSWSMDDFKSTLTENKGSLVLHRAPSSGLMLYQITFL